MACDVAKLGGEVDASHAAAEAAGEIARRAADAAADVQNVIVVAYLEGVRELRGRLEPPAVKLVVGG